MNQLQILSQTGTRSAGCSLHSAFNQIYKSSSKNSRKHVSGCDDVTLELFKNNLQYNLSQLSIELRSKKGYKFSALKPILIPKPKGNYRVICIPTVKDRIVQKSILNYLETTKINRFNNINYGFIKKKSIEDAVERILKIRIKNPCVVKTDICRYFDNIDRDLLYEKIKLKVRAKSIHELLRNVIHCEIGKVSPQKISILRKNGIKINYGLRQGMPLSPFLSNLFLSDFDKSIEKQNIKMVRYADDLIFFAKNIKECNHIIKICEKELKKLNLQIPQINTTKTMIARPDDAVEFLGVSIKRNMKNKNYIATLTRFQKQKIKEKFNDLSSIEYLTSQNIKLKNLLNKIETLTRGYQNAYEFCDKNTKNNLENTLGKHKENTINRIFKKYFDIDVSKLSKNQKIFLDLE
jgi:group II intron reverse transcriptase/maturase